jgi:hypothetical protein
VYKAKEKFFGWVARGNLADKIQILEGGHHAFEGKLNPPKDF